MLVPVVVRALTLLNSRVWSLERTPRNEVQTSYDYSYLFVNTHGTYYVHMPSSAIHLSKLNTLNMIRMSP